MLKPALFLCALCLLTGCTLLHERSVKYIQYPVKSGDTLSAIAARFNSSSGEISDINDIDDPRELEVGQLLRIPYRIKSKTQNGTTSKYSSVPEGAASRGGSSKSELKKIKLSSAGKYVGKLLWPVRGGKNGSPFGWRWLSFHEGIDIAAPEGTPIYVAHSGVVVYSGSGLRGYGNLIVVKTDGLLTVYGHNSENDVRVGEQVSRGEKIGEVGSTGHSSGSHLHFETRIRDEKGKNAAVNPLVFY